MSDFNKIGYFKCLRGRKLRGGAVRVLTALYSYSDADGGNAHPGIGRLARDCCMGESTVREHLTLLIDQGFIRLERRGGRSGDKQAWASTYRLCIPGSVNISTAENLAIDNDSQPPDLDSQPPDLPASTAENSAPTKSLPSPLTPSPLAALGGTRARRAPRTREEQGLHPLPENEWIEPPEFCPLHPTGTTEKCIPCKIQRKENRAWIDTYEEREARYWADHPDELAKAEEADELRRRAREAELAALFGNGATPQ